MKRALPISLCLVLLAGCNEEDNRSVAVDNTPCNASHMSASIPFDDTPMTQVGVVVTTAASDYSSGAHSYIDMADYTNVTNNLLPTISDTYVVAFGEDIYRIERSGADNVTHFKQATPGTPEWQYTTLDEGEQTSGNPHDLIPISQNRAALIRYGKATSWLVDLTATSAADFKVCEIDLSAYNSGDTTPEATRAVIANNKLFIAMQNLVNWAPGQAYVAVFDLTTFDEIDTGHAGDNLKGIPLIIQNPQQMEVSEATGLIYLQGMHYSDDTYTGGIESIDPTDYANSLVVDDNSTANGGIGRIAGFAITSAEQGYLVSYAGWKSNSIYSFNPTTGTVNPTPINQSLVDIAIGPIAMDDSGLLWVSNQTLIGMTVINSTDNSIVNANINTSINPIGIAFVSSPVTP